jgi:hypothetical protein
MAGIQTVLTITHGNEPANTLSNLLVKSTTAAKPEIEALINFLDALAGGNRIGKIDVQVNGGVSVAASATLTLSTAGTAGDNVSINGVAITAVASGAVNNQYAIAGTAALTAANLAAAINASTTSLVSGLVVASVVGAVVTVSAVSKGIAGNAITLASGQGDIVASSARLVGGVAVTLNTYHYGV